MNLVLTIFLLFMLIATVLATNYDLIHPAAIFSILWFVSSFFYMLMANQWSEPCSFSTLVFTVFCNTLCGLLMIAGSRVHFRLKNREFRIKIYKRSLGKEIKFGKWKSRIIVAGLVVFYVISTRMLLYRVGELASLAARYTNSTNNTYLARISEINGAGFGQLYINLMRVNIAIGIVLAKKVADLIFIYKKRYFKFIPFLLYSVFFSVIRGSRNDMMYVLGAYLFIFIYYIYKNSTNRRVSSMKAFKYLMAFMTIIVIMWGISGVLFSRVGTSAISSIIGYVGGPFAGFNYLIEHPDWISSDYFGQNTFDSIYKMVNRFGLVNVSSSSIYLPQTGSTDLRINVYTMYGRYFADFGLGGSIILTSIFGLFYGLVYGKLRQVKGKTGEETITLIYACCMYPLIMSFFEDRFYSYVNSTIILIVFTLLLNRFVFKNISLQSNNGRKLDG